MNRRTQDETSEPRRSRSELLETKLSAPPARAGTISRARLLARLDAAITHRLTAVVAPAGYGKSALLAEWCAARNTPVAWLTLEPHDTDPSRFWRYLVASIERRCRRPLDRTRSLYAIEETPPERLVTALLADLASEADLVLVLDDYHVIESDEIHRALRYLLDHAPPALHLIVASRSDPPLALARHRARGHLVEIRTAELRFDSDEALLFLERTMGLQLPEPQARVLAARSEGWIVALLLAALALRDDREIQPLLDAFDGTHRYVADFLFEEVLAQRDESTQRMLLDCSIVERFTPSLCDALTQRSDCALRLDRLTRENMLLERLDDDGEWYRFHALLRELLRSRLERTDPERVPTLHGRASLWYERAGLVPLAVRHALAAGDEERAASLIEGVGLQLLLEGGFGRVERWLNALPRSLVERPRLALLRAWILLRGGRFDELVPLLQQIESASASGCDPDVAGQLAALRTFVALALGDVAEAIEEGEEALAIMPLAYQLLRGMIAINLASLYASRGEGERVADLLERVRAEGGDGSEGLYIRARLLADQGRLQRAAQTFRRVVQGDAPNVVLQAAARVQLGVLLCEWNDLEGAQRYLESALAQGDRLFITALCMIQVGLAHVHLVRGERVLGRERLALGLELAQRSRGAPFMAPTRAAAVRLSLLLGDEERARDWYRSGGSHDEPAASALPIERLAHARLLAARGECAAALEQLERIEELLGHYRIPALMIQLLVLRARLLERETDALDALARAIELAEPEGYIRSILDEGEPITRLLQRLRRTRPELAPAYVRALLRAARHATDSAAPRAHPVEPLTRRELEVLARVAEGLTDDEIAHALHVQTSTVRTHLRNLFGKLAARNRVEAVIRAQADGLLRDPPHA